MAGQSDPPGHRPGCSKIANGRRRQVVQRNCRVVMPRQADLRSQLAVGRHALDPARVLQITELIRAYPRRAARLIELLWDDDPGVANRAADTLERVYHHPSPALRRIVYEFKEALIGLLPEARSIKLRWNLAF